MAVDIKLRHSERELLKVAEIAEDQGKHVELLPDELAALVNRIGRLRTAASPESPALRAVTSAVESILTYDDPMMAHDLGALLEGKKWLEELSLDVRGDH